MIEGDSREDWKQAAQVEAGVRRELQMENEKLRALLMRCHQWINPDSDPMDCTNRQLMAEIETAIARNS